MVFLSSAYCKKPLVRGQIREPMTAHPSWLIHFLDCLNRHSLKENTHKHQQLCVDTHHQEWKKSFFLRKWGERQSCLLKTFSKVTNSVERATMSRKWPSLYTHLLFMAQRTLIFQGEPMQQHQILFWIEHVLGHFHDCHKSLSPLLRSLLSCNHLLLLCRLEPI